MVNIERMEGCNKIELKVQIPFLATWRNDLISFIKSVNSEKMHIKYKAIYVRNQYVSCHKVYYN